MIPAGPASAGERGRLTGEPAPVHAVRIEGDLAVPTFKGSGEITSLSQADGYIEIDSDTEVVEAGALVDVKFF